MATSEGLLTLLLLVLATLALLRFRRTLDRLARSGHSQRKLPSDMRPFQLAYRLCAAGPALSVMVNRAIGEELEEQLPRVVTCPLAPHNLPPPSHHGTLSVSVIDETSSTIAIVPDYLMGVPEDRWERWPALVTQTPHYWLLVPSDMNRPTLMLMKHLDQPGVALGVLEPPLHSSHYIRCWIPRDRQ